MATLKSVHAQCPELRRALVLEDDWAGLHAGPSTISDAALAAREASLGFDDPINIQYTSGTTGFPKGATLTHHNILNNGFFIGEGFDPAAVLEAVQAERCTALYGVPTMFIAELEHARFDEFDLSSLRTGIMAGSPCPVETMKAVQARMHLHQMTICYGMTETSPVSTQSALDDPLDKRVGTVGRVHPHVEVKIVGPETGATVRRGAPGELCTRGYSVMLGYWDNREATAAALDPSGWMHTGDLATMDDEGYVQIVGRIKDMIIRGGENIYPREVEEFLHSHPGVSEVQVIGVPSQRYGEEVMAWVKPRPGVTLTDAELTAFCTGKIATFKIPRYWKVVDGFPMTVTGKIQKFLMREQSHAELGTRP